MPRSSWVKPSNRSKLTSLPVRLFTKVSIFWTRIGTARPGRVCTRDIRARGFHCQAGRSGAQSQGELTGPPRSATTAYSLGAAFRLTAHTEH